MKHWLRLASRFYPAAWRRRYGVEFEALLDEAGAGWMDFFDILKGALTMHFTSWNLKTIAIVFAAIGAAISATVAFSIPNQYRSMSVMRLTPATGDAQAAQQLVAIAREALSRTYLEDLILKLGLYKAQRSRTPMEDIVQKVRRDVTVRMVALPEGRALRRSLSKPLTSIRNLRRPSTRNCLRGSSNSNGVRPLAVARA